MYRYKWKMGKSRNKNTIGVYINYDEYNQIAICQSACNCMIRITILACHDQIEKFGLYGLHKYAHRTELKSQN